MAIDATPYPMSRKKEIAKILYLLVTGASFPPRKGGIANKFPFFRHSSMSLVASREACPSARSFCPLSRLNYFGRKAGDGILTSGFYISCFELFLRRPPRFRPIHSDVLIES